MKSIIAELFPHLDLKAVFHKPFSEVGIDSFDLIVLRTTIEQRFQRLVADEHWTDFRCLGDIEEHLVDRGQRASSSFSDGSRSSHGSYSSVVNMPQMCLGGLSEQWLFKELGDQHWRLVCEALGAPSDKIADGMGNRLYATFVRFRWEGSASLRAVCENDRAALAAFLSRFGKSMFFSRFEGSVGSLCLRANLSSTFALRVSDNKTLLKGEPMVPESCFAESLSDYPSAAVEYRAMRKGELNALELGGFRFDVSDSSILFETEHDWNPYIDINGVNLLYFAAYPMIHDLCERRWASRDGRGEKGRDWAQCAAVRGRDIFYFANCNLDDTIIFRLHCMEKKGHRIGLHSSLLRKSDGQILARIFTVKDLNA